MTLKKNCSEILSTADLKRMYGLVLPSEGKKSDEEDLFKFPPTMSFREVCHRLDSVNFDNYYDAIKMVLLSFTIKIYNLPECPEKDLPLAVYLFLEELLGIRAPIEMCARFNEYTTTNITGVVFKTTEIQEDVLKKAKELNLSSGSSIMITQNYSMQWILDNWSET